MNILKKSILLVVLLLFIILQCFAQNVSDVDSPQTLNDLKDSIQKILIETNTPGAGIIMMSDDTIVMLAGLGKADIENNIDVDENTMFRLGSVSKLFVGLAILKLQEEGSISLKDKVIDIIPDLKIINPWEDEYPIRIENLLEHTSGLSDYSLAELGSNDSKPKTLKESLEFYPKARVAKFVPETRVQYSNLAVSMAAYIVELVSGLAYEDYIAINFFKPMKMENMTFRYSEQFKKTAAKGYDNGIPLSINYLHVLYRPSVALNASPKDMMNMIKFFINRGKINGIQIISDSSLKRMERMESLHIEKSYVFKDNGLVNYSSYYKGFVYHGHGGSVPGYNSDFAYLPEYNMGFAVMINGNNQNVINNISSLIKAYQTKDLPQKNMKPKKILCKTTQDISAYYINVNYKFDALKFLKKIKSIKKIWQKDDTLYVKNILGKKYLGKFCPNGNNEFVSVESDRFVIFPTNDPVEGEVIYGRMGMMKKISPIYAYSLLIIFFAFFIISVTTMFFAVLSILIYLFGKKKNKVALWISVWPFITISQLLIVVIVLNTSIKSTVDIFLSLGNISPLSVLIFIATICFALASAWSIYYIFKNIHAKMSRVFFYHSVVAAVFNLIFTIYLLSNGFIGIQTWS